MGSVRGNGRTLIDHDGGTPNFQASLFFDPVEHVGVFLAANVCGALDAFSSPPGPDSRDGPTLRAMSQSVLSIATHRPLPNQGIGHERLYLLYNFILGALSSLLAISLARIPARGRRLRQLGVDDSSHVLWRSSRTAALHFVLPVVVLAVAVALPAWRGLITLYQPDLAYWLAIAALVLVLKGFYELALIRRAFRRT
jgi:hypothetical protein